MAGFMGAQPQFNANFFSQTTAQHGAAGGAGTGGAGGGSDNWNPHGAKRARPE